MGSINWFGFDGLLAFCFVALVLVTIMAGALVRPRPAWFDEEQRAQTPRQAVFGIVIFGAILALLTASQVLVPGCVSSNSTIEAGVFVMAWLSLAGNLVNAVLDLRRLTRSAARETTRSAAEPFGQTGPSS